MTTLLIDRIDYLATFDDQRHEWRDAAMLIRDNQILWAGPRTEKPELPVDEILDLSGHVVMPGMVNTHHHMYQNFTRVMAQDDPLFPWLNTLYPIWARLDDEAIYLSSKVAMAELLLSGCTTAADHLYMLPNGARLDSQIQAAGEMGIRFHAARGAMSRGQSQGGLPPDNCVEKEDHILCDAERLIRRYHDAGCHSMLRLVLAPCSPFSVTPELMRDAAQLARRHQGVRLHCHLAEELDEEDYCLAQYGMRSVAFAESVEWLGEDVWFAHGIFLDDEEIALLARTGTGIAHCPSANMRCGQGIAKVRQLLDAGVPVGLGVDGSASNDSSNLFLEARMAMMLQRVAPARYRSEAPGGRGGFGGDPGALSAREALILATRGGARLLGRDDIGHLAPGMSADWVAVDMNHLSFAGAQRDPLAALVMCGPFLASQVMVNGRMRVRDGQLLGTEPAALIREHARAMTRLYQ